MVRWNEEDCDVIRTTGSVSRRLGKAAAAASSEKSYRKSDRPTNRMMNGKGADKKKEAAVVLPPRRNSNDHGLAQEDRDLPPLYYITTALCVFMVVWILIFPASAFQEHSAWRRQLFGTVVHADSSTPPEIVTKYAGHYLVHATHILPGAVWAALIPLQLHPGIRHRFPTWHRWSGRVFLVTALVMAYGVWLILQRRLGFKHFFDDIGDDDPSSFTEPGLLALTFYFVATVCGAVYYARLGRYADHRCYMIRHIASGIWIAIQRIILTTILPILRLGGPFTRHEQRSNFGSSAILAMAITFLTGEYAIYTLRHRRQTTTRRCSAKRVD
jgi:hypothetical protein